MTNDLELLQDYVRDSAEDAFAALVNRYLNLVYSAALRQVRLPQLAEEVAQAVFIDLARDAVRLRPDTILASWLYQVTRRTAIDVVRRESRRQLREQIAWEMNAMHATATDWTAIGPLLDEAMDALEENERAAVLLRYFENLSLREVGEKLGISDDAAQKRVSRAVDRLRAILAGRGVRVGAASLIVLISAHAVHAAPAGLALTITTASLGGAAPASAAAAHAIWNLAHVKVAAAILTAALAAGTTVYFAQEAAEGRVKVENRELGAQLDRVAGERDAALSAGAKANSTLAQLRSNQLELLRLRSEVSRLRSEVREFSRLRARASTASYPLMSTSGGNLSPEEGADDCINNLRIIAAAMRRCAVEHHLNATNVITAEQILPYLADNRMPRCPSGGTYVFWSLTNAPGCSVPGHALPSETTVAELEMGAIVQAAVQDDKELLNSDDLAAAREAFIRDHDGRPPKGLSDLVIYLREPGHRLREAEEAYRREHDGREATNAVELAPYVVKAEGGVRKGE